MNGEIESDLHISSSFYSIKCELEKSASQDLNPSNVKFDCHHFSLFENVCNISVKFVRTIFVK